MCLCSVTVGDSDLSVYLENMHALLVQKLKAVQLSLLSQKYLCHCDLMWLQMMMFSSLPLTLVLPPFTSSLICLVSLSPLSVFQCDWRLWSDQLSKLLQALQTERRKHCWGLCQQQASCHFLLLLRNVKENPQRRKQRFSVYKRYKVKQVRNPHLWEVETTAS